MKIANVDVALADAVSSQLHLKKTKGTPVVKIEKKLEPIMDQVINLWSAPSSSQFGTKHYVMLMQSDPAPGENVTDAYFLCSCKGFQYNNNCWHVEQAAEAIDD